MGPNGHAPADTHARGVRDATGLEDGLARYETERAIGRGHFSTVHKALQTATGRLVAMKKVVFDSMDAKSRERCLKEVQLLQSLDAHPCIIEYIDAFIDNNELYIIFEWAAHGDLRRLIKKAHEADVLFDEASIWRYFVQIADAIRHMHAHRIMHRDIKPANIFLSANGAVKLGDLGLGRAFSSQTFEAQSKVGTPLYMSPEVLDGRGYEWKSDVWSLGVLLYELCTLRSPFKGQGDNLYMLFQKISRGAYEPIPEQFSPALHSLVAAMLRTDPTLRPDIDTVLQAARQAALSAASAASGSSAMPESAYLVMEAILDKLKLLDYERRFLRRDPETPLKPIGRTHFAHATDTRSQFLLFCRLIEWLAQDLCRVEADLRHILPASATDPAFDQASRAAATAALQALEAMCSASDHSEAGCCTIEGLSPVKLIQGYGLHLCLALNVGLDAALLIQGFVFQAPVFSCNGDMLERDLDEADVDEAFCSGDQQADCSEDEGNIEASTLKSAQLDDDGLRRINWPPVLGRVPSTLWEEEVERLSLQLTNVLARHEVPNANFHCVVALWRQHAAALRTSANLWFGMLERVEKRAPKVAAELARRAGHVAPLIGAARESEALHAERAERVDEASRTLQRSVAELEELEERIARARVALDERGLAITDTKPIRTIKRALKQLKGEEVELAIQVATTQSLLLMHRLRELNLNDSAVTRKPMIP